MIKTTCWGILFSAGSACLASAQVFAQGQDTSASLLEEIIITAEKRTERLQDASISVSAFTSNTRDEIGILTVQDLTDFTPGLHYSSSLDRITLRGIGRFTNNLASDPGVAVYSDGFFTSSTVEAGKTPMFIDRIEVLRGPQGTLYGRNSIGGAINVISKRPTDLFFGEFRTSAGNYDRHTFEYLASGPITDNIRFLVGGNTIQQDDGYFKNVVEGLPSEGGVRDDQFYTAQLEANFGALDLALKYQRGEWKRHSRSSTRVAPYDTHLGVNGAGQGTALLPGTSLAPSALYNTGVAYVPANALAGLMGPHFGFNQALVPALSEYTATNPGVDNPREFRANTPSSSSLDGSDAYVLDATWNFSSVDLRYLGGYNSYRYQQRSDFDGTDRLAYDYRDPFMGQTVTINPNYIFEYMEAKEWSSHEVNLSSDHSGDFQWLLGLYQYDEEYDQTATVYNPDQAQLRTTCLTINFATCAMAPTMDNPRGEIYHAGTTMHANDSFAYFGQIDWAFTKTLSMTLGLRHTKDSKDATESTRIVRWDPTLNAAANALDITRLLTANNDTSRDLLEEWDASTGTFGLEWAPQNDILTYAKYTRGYKSGGFNSGTIAVDASVDEETIDAYELGLKSTLGDRFRLNVAAFYYDYQDFQNSVLERPSGGGPLETVYINLPKAESLGLEFESTWAATDHLQFLFNYSWLDAKVKEACCFVDASDRAALSPGARPVAGAVIDPRTGTQALDPVSGEPQRAQDLAGNRLPSSPEHKLALNIRYTLDFDPGYLTFSLSDTWRSETNYDLFDRPDSTADEYNQVDFRLLWEDAFDRYTFIASVQNALNQDGFDGMGSEIVSEVANQSGSLTPPRIYNLELQYRFGIR